ncbi:MAG: HD domain-containing protein [Clostridia bacterium]|nr:HD domain-containing protein [Clostridia bacterium]
MKIKLPTNVQKAISLLEAAGFEAYAVGGCVRDSLLGKTPDDWDITTSATPEQMKSVFSGFHCIETGIQHGTLTVVIDSSALEITTFRLDGEYEDNRHPKTVEFTCDLTADLARRDFTVNAMAYSPSSGISDPFGGKEDLKNNVVCCVGDADRRFNEDALRILRGLRFASVLDFTIDPETADSIHKNKDLLKNISVERISKELLRLICGAGAHRVLSDFSDVLFTVLPQLQPMYKNSHDNPHHCYDIYEHTLFSLESISPDPVLRFAMLLHDSGKPASKTFDEKGRAHFYGHQKVSAEIAADILAQLKLPNKFRDEVLFLIDNHDRWELYEKSERMKKYLARFGLERTIKLLQVMRADVLSQSPEYHFRLESIAAAEQLAKELAALEPCLTLKSLAVNGRTLINHGIPEGKDLGAVLSALLEEVIDEKIPNDSNALIVRAKEIFEQTKKQS